MPKKQLPVGIDLGTTFSAIAYIDNDGRPCTITNSEGELTTPSVVFFDDDAVIVGSEAAYAGESDVSRLARAAKRDMGGSKYRKMIQNRHLPPEVIQSFVLQRLKADAELKLGEVKKAVVTVPAYFNEPRRKATMDAGELAGLDVIDIINEPTAAALAYGVQRGFLNEKGESEVRELILVYDLGGGTFDVTLMEIDKARFTAIGTAGDVYLGGIDWDKRIFDFACEEIRLGQDVDVESDPRLVEKLLNQCVRAKKTLTARSETVIRLEHEGNRYSVNLSREKFEELTQDLLERTRLTTDRLLREAKLDWKDLTKLLLVGGSTRMPMVLEMLEKESGLKVDRSLSPDESVAHGAAIYAGILMKHGPSVGTGISVTNVNSHDLGVLGIDPKTREPRRRIVIPRNHQLPAKSSKKFQTSKDGQKKIVVQIVEGGTDEGHGASTIGKCVVTDLPGDIKKGTEVKVTFNYLSSGRLKVIAEVPQLNLKADSAIDRSSGMTRDELKQWKIKLAKGVKFLVDEPQVVAVKPKSAAAYKTPSTDAANPVANRKPAAIAKSATPKPAAAKPAAPKPAGKPVAKPAGKSKPQIAVPVGKAAKPAKAASDESVESGMFNFGDEKPKSLVGASAINVLQNDNEGKLPEDFDAAESAIFAFEEGEKKADVGESMIDFLKDASDDKPDVSGTGLDDFLSEME